MEQPNFYQLQNMLVNILRAGAVYRIPLDATVILAHRQIPVAATLIYQAGVETQTLITEIMLHNSNAAVPRIFTMWIVSPTEATPTAVNQIYFFTMAASLTVTYTGRTVLLPGWSVWMSADVANEINVHMSGTEVPAS